MGNKVAPAMAMRRAASCTGGNKAEPSRANNPIFMRMKLLPHTKPSRSSTKAGAQRWGGEEALVAMRVLIAAEIRLELP